MCSCRRIASVMPLSESPDTPYMRSTPAPASVSTSKSATFFFAMALSFLLCRREPQGRRDVTNDCTTAYSAVAHLCPCAPSHEAEGQCQRISHFVSHARYLVVDCA